MMGESLMLTGLKRAGVKITPQRIAICDWLENNDSHPTASDVFDALHSRLPSMSKATVYNTLKLLETLDLIHEIGTALDGSTRYDAIREPHLNLVCRLCGTIVDFPAVDFQKAWDAAEEGGFHPHDMSVVIHGICQTCSGSLERKQQ